MPSQVWTNFQKALLSVGCDYWANWFLRLFENDFDYDPEEIKIRFNTPKEIRRMGAAMVGVHMEHMMADLNCR